MRPGTYVLVIELAGADRIEVGALGSRRFPPGWYAYVGSAFGPGGLTRVERHRRVADEQVSTRHWHVDHLLASSVASLERTIAKPDMAVECAVAASLPPATVNGFGASDCQCPTHLSFHPRRDRLLETILRAFDGASHPSHSR